MQHSIKLNPAKLLGNGNRGASMTGTVKPITSPSGK